MSELLALRDGEGGTFGSEHIAVCSACRQELQRLQRIRAELRALPVLRPSRSSWPSVAAALKRRRLRQRVGLAAIALAAAAMAGFVVLGGTGSPAGRDGGSLDPWVAEAISEDLGPIIHRSRELESLLRVYTPESRVYDAPTALAVSVLEDRIVMLDRLLSESRSLGADRELIRGLWSARVEALETLVGVELVSRQGVWR